MSAIHILGKDNNEHYTIVFHFTINSRNNTANVRWSDALRNSKFTSPSIMVEGDGTGGTISSTEKADLDNCLVVERNIKTTIDLTRPADIVRADLQRLYNRELTSFQAAWENRLAYFGTVEGII